MSEPKIVELKKEDRELLRSNIDAMKKAAETKPVVEAKHEETPKHEHFGVSLEYMEKGDSCPECVKGLDQFGKEYLRKTLDAQKDLSHECVNCGLGVDGKISEPESWKCANCGEGNARERD